MAKQQGISMYVVPRTVKRTVDSLSRLEKNIETAIGRVIAEIGINIHRESKQNAPVDFGFLRASVYFDYKGTGKFGQASINSVGANSGQVGKQLSIPTIAPESRKDGLNAIIGSDLDYSEKMNYKTKFMTNAYNNWKDRVKPNIEKAVIDQIKKAARL
jgi:hypothetical protein